MRCVLPRELEVDVALMPTDRRDRIVPKLADLVLAQTLPPVLARIPGGDHGAGNLAAVLQRWPEAFGEPTTYPSRIVSLLDQEAGKLDNAGHVAAARALSAAGELVRGAHPITNSGSVAHMRPPQPVADLPQVLAAILHAVRQVCGPDYHTDTLIRMQAELRKAVPNSDETTRSLMRRHAPPRWPQEARGERFRP